MARLANGDERLGAHRGVWGFSLHNPSGIDRVGGTTMVAVFKLHRGKHPVYSIDRASVEKHIAGQAPWFVPGQTDRHYAICPYCDNPIQLKALYARGEKSPLPYGSHVGKPVAGFAFKAEAQACCPYLSVSGTVSQPAERKFDDVAVSLIETAVAEFDRIVLVLRDDIGFRFSDAFAGRMLERWFASKGYLYPGAHLRNLPWMIAYFGGVQNLFGQPLGQNESLKQAIQATVPAARLDRKGRLFAVDDFVLLKGQVLDHKAELVDDVLQEYLRFRVLDFTHANIPDAAPILFETEIVCRPQRFEGLMHTAPERAKRDRDLLALAREIGERAQLHVS